MSADFKHNSLFRAFSVVIEDECLVVLEADGNRDRMRRVHFDQVQSLAVWSSVPWLITILSGLMLLVATLLTVAYLSEREPVVLVFSGIFLFGGIVTAIVALYWRRTRLRLVRDGVNHDFRTFIRPGKRRRIVEKIRTNIERVQERERARRAQSQASPEPEPEPEPDTFEPPSDLTPPPLSQA